MGVASFVTNLARAYLAVTPFMASEHASPDKEQEQRTNSETLESYK
jgi:hypothetical protein